MNSTNGNNKKTPIVLISSVNPASSSAYMGTSSANASPIAPFLLRAAVGPEVGCSRDQRPSSPGNATTIATSVHHTEPTITTLKQDIRECRSRLGVLRVQERSATAAVEASSRTHQSFTACFRTHTWTQHPGAAPPAKMTPLPPRPPPGKRSRAGWTTARYRGHPFDTGFSWRTVRSAGQLGRGHLSKTPTTPALSYGRLRLGRKSVELAAPQLRIPALHAKFHFRPGLGDVRRLGRCGLIEGLITICTGLSVKDTLPSFARHCEQHFQSMP